MISVTDDGNGTATADAISATVGTPITLTTTPNEGYMFKGWQVVSGGVTILNDGFSMPENDVKVKAIFEEIPPEYTVIVTDDGNGTATADVLSATVGTLITLTATPNERYVFKEWQVVSGGITISNDGFSMPENDVEVKAIFEEIPSREYNVTVSNDGNGSARASVTSGKEGTEVTVTANANEGYKFSGWEIVSGETIINDAKSATTTLLIGTSDVEVKATFEEIPEEPEITDLKPQTGSEEPSEPQPAKPEIVEPTEPQPTEPETPEEPASEPEPEVEIPEKDWLDDLRLALNIAAELDGRQTVEYSGDFALSYEIMNYLVEHSSITLIYHVTYQGVEYTITIPAGKAISYSDIEWYGPLWLLANYGNGNVPTGAKGNGTYVVKSGDTLTGISVKLGVTVQYLVDKNNIADPDKIYAEQVLSY